MNDKGREVQSPDAHGIGIYIHIPFCNGKCPYCDFYSVSLSPEISREYTAALEREFANYRDYGITADTIYFGGGTPPLLGTDNIKRLLESLHSNFIIENGSEITLEMNPLTVGADSLSALKSAGFNRLSIGAQSGCDNELTALGRKHKAEDVRRAVHTARDCGFDNLSLDLMLGIPEQTTESLKKSLEFILSCEPEHISAYLLKLEPGTLFFEKADLLDLADDDMQADFYLAMSTVLSENGFRQYEISNFSKKGRESRHNLKYWNCDEYLGFGPSAHSFFDGRRFYYPRSIDGFIRSPELVQDGVGGTQEEYTMLRLRLAEGIVFTDWQRRFGVPFPESSLQEAQILSAAGLTECDEAGLRITAKGFLVSNSIITKIIG